jgi:hypothetical protein
MNEGGGIMVTKAVQKAQEKMNNDTGREIVMWSPSSWAAWKQCPMKWRIRADRWSHPETKTDKRIATLAVPGLVIDRLFELWLYRGEFEDRQWLHDHFNMVWRMIRAKRKPKWKNPSEETTLLKQTLQSVDILYGLLHRHHLLNANHMKIQTEFHEMITGRIAIAGAIDLCTMRNNKTLVLVDFKNFQSAKKRSTDQLHIYAMAIEKMFGRTPDEAGYLCFHPAFPGYRIRMLRHCDRNKLMARLERATEARFQGRIQARYSYWYCPRYCECRFGCDAFLKACGARPDDRQVSPSR